MRRACLSSLGVVLSCAVLPAGAAVERPMHAVGYVITDETLGPLPPLPAGATPPELGGGAEPGKVWAVIEVPWAERDEASRAAALAALRARVDALRAVDQTVVLAIAGNRGVVDPTSDAARKQWLDWLRTVVRSLDGSVAWYLLSGLEPPAGGDPSARTVAFDIKAATVTVRAEDPDAGVGLALADRAALQRLAAIYQEAPDLEAYVDAVALHLARGETAAQAVDFARQILLPIDPGALLWLRANPTVEAGSDREREDAVLRAAAAILSARADLALFELPPAAGTDPVRPPLAGRALRVIARTLHTGLAASTTTSAGIEPASESPASLRWSRWFDDRNFQEAILYWSDDPALDPAARVSFSFDTVLRRNFRVLDPVSGNPGKVDSEKLDGQRARIDLPLAARPRLLTFALDKASEGLLDAAEEGEVEGVRGLTADEVIAIHQRFRAFQDDRLHTVRASSAMRLRVGLGGETGSVELLLQGDYFWDRAVGAEWTIKEKYVEGVRLKWDTLPEIPYIGVERAVQPPLELRLDKRYRYSLDDEQTIDGYRCWVLRFEPTDTSLSLQRGRAWIDQTSGALVRADTVQNHLEPPVVSNQETQEFRPIIGPDGVPYWVVVKAEGQQLYTISGANLVVLRVTTFTEQQLNDPGFAEARARAYESDLQMLRDSQQGMIWLSKDETGQRVENSGDTRHMFLVGGIYKEGETVLPVAGLNYTDIDFLGDKNVLNIFFAGIFANVALSDPQLFGTALDAGVNATLSAVPSIDRDYELAEEVEERAVGNYTQSLSASVGYPLWNYFKLKAGVGLDYLRYSQGEDTTKFEVPSDHFATRVRLGASFDRSGWGAEVESSWSRRSTWDPWGPDDALVTGPELERAKGFSTYRLSVGKSFFLPYFQKAGFAATYEAGGDLDRFSAFTFGLLSGSRLRGFGDAGIRYDRGLLAQLDYGLALGEAVKLQLSLDWARVHDERISRDTSDHTGIGLAANFVGPWKTMVRIDAGYALRSDLAQAEGDIEFYVAFLKLFD